MTDFQSWFFASWILCYLSISKCSDIIVQSFEGESVILPCKYDSKYHGKCAICWMIGDIPNMGCGNEIIGSDGDKVVRTQSSRYQLEGRIKHGDVSLTILNVKKTDSGKYGCRIHVPGLFNDEKYYVHLIVKDVETSTTHESSSIVSSTNAPESSTIGLWLSDTTYETSYDNRESSSLENKDSVNASAVIVPVLLLLLALIVIAVILIWKRKKKTRVSVDITQNSETSVIYSNSGSSLGLYNRDMALENIFQIHPENEYEQWH
ncbi:hepatitis A virus cellular receptor 1 isoform X4 [Carassius carassius]|uniref:hepatitis A virus cellular receptor 1 isoform X4 n=1 Tax=Carassius carassius TaxID=217509 RepID=UPI002868FFAD|nr:hepatitis A virus cellular receptor 1 isoform X4 [Carassius carassius]